jgi:hypothetical protein
MEATLKAFLSIRRWRGGELDRGGGHAARMGVQSTVPTQRGARQL